MKDPFRRLAKIVKSKREITRGKKLTKKRGNLTGVCAGLGDYLEIDPILIRAGFIAGAFFLFGTSILLYLGLSVALPDDEAEKWGGTKYTYQDYENQLDEKQVIRRNDPLIATSLSVCPNCDTVAKPKSKFCHKCGTML